MKKPILGRLLAITAMVAGMAATLPATAQGTPPGTSTPIVTPPSSTTTPVTQVNGISVAQNIPYATASSYTEVPNVPQTTNSVAEVTDGPQVEIGGNERYVSVSRAEFKKIMAGDARVELPPAIPPLDDPT